MPLEPGPAPWEILSRGADPRLPIDTWISPWRSLRDAFFGRDDEDSVFLVEMRDTGASAQRRSWTVAEWKREVATTAAGLLAAGVRPGDGVAALCGNSAGSLATAFATWAIGSCYAPLDPTATDPLQSRAIQAGGVRAITHTAAYARRAGELAIELGIATVDLERLPMVGPDALASLPEPGWNRPVLSLHSGGSTGTPKSVQLTASNLAVNVDAMITAFAWGAETRTLCVLPIHHGNGLLINSVVPWFAGGSVVLRDRLRISTFWKDAAAEGVTTASLVPTVLDYLNAGPAAEAGMLTEVFSGSGPLPTRTAVAFEDKFGIAVRQLYGLAETTAVLTVTPRAAVIERRQWHNAGRMLSAGTVVQHAEVAVLSPAGRHCDDGHEGQVVARGGMVMQGYSDSVATAAAFADGWFHTGDRGLWWRDSSGARHLFITGRTKEIIVRGGGEHRSGGRRRCSAHTSGRGRRSDGRVRAPPVRRGGGVRRRRGPAGRRRRADHALHRSFGAFMGSEGDRAAKRDRADVHR